MSAKLELSADYQRKVGELVSREVIYCVSTLVSEMFKAGLNGTFNNADELYQIMAQDDWETAAEDNDCFENGQFWYHEDTAYSSASDFCESNNIDPYQNEALEHWIVSDYLADKLEAAGEMVLRDFMGLTIWGRTTSGQSILLDGVICGIYNELHK